MTDALVEDLRALARVPSAVPPGADTLLAPDHPIIANYLQAVRPRFAELAARVPGATPVDLPLGQFGIRICGRRPGPVLMLMAYLPTQHHNEMRDPWSGDLRVPPGGSEPAVYGQGVTQNKAHQAVLLELLRRLGAEGGIETGTLWLCLNSEGRSSHGCTNAILDALPTPPDLVVQLFCTDLVLTTGNRGRVDIHVELAGEATHSSSPPTAGRVIDAAADVVVALRELDREAARHTHPELGAERVVPYLVQYEPLAPHTLPHHARITVDRRLLPGTTPEAATTELATGLSRLLGENPGGCAMNVRQGVAMLPYELDAADRPVLAPLEAVIRERFGEVRHGVYPGTFDAGGPAARGIPAVMFGVPDSGGLLGDDYLALPALRDEADIVHDAVVRYLGTKERQPR
ncbi:peptidase dimerization domain-containing protein [Amycolatopsis jejuensis]|uniref:peptidase dimerization domain-containing protein n=1 Tax=Amycolatopsis jejuensis TaxID=330084 RepID=UPI0005276DA6|nr:peptidase dimerization domain-containing protein [Amycolatopsis jejuensis]